MAVLNEIVIGTAAQVKDETFDENSLYGVTDYPIGGITNAQMAAALTPLYNALYQAGEVFICSDTGTYVKGRAYKFTGTSWELVTEFDTTPTADSVKPVTSNGIKNYVDTAVNSGKATSGTATLLAASWSGTSYSLTISDLGANDTIIFYPASATDQENAASAGIFISPVTSGTSVTITAQTAPTVDIAFVYSIIKGAA